MISFTQLSIQLMSKFYDAFLALNKLSVTFLTKKTFVAISYTTVWKKLVLSELLYLNALTMIGISNSNPTQTCITKYVQTFDKISCYN